MHILFNRIPRESKLTQKLFSHSISCSILAGNIQKEIYEKLSDKIYLIDDSSKLKQILNFLEMNEVPSLCNAFICQFSHFFV